MAVVIPSETELLLIYISYGAFGNQGAVAITLAMLFFSIPPAIGEMIVIPAVVVVAAVPPTITVFCPTILSLPISDTFMVNVPVFLMESPLENVFTH